jgi:hypothetical protein
MADLVKARLAFTSGELDPLLLEREDIRFYDTGASLMENVVCLPQGGFVGRHGFALVDQVVFAVRDGVRLISMPTDDDRRHIVLLYAFFADVWRDGVKLLTVSHPFSAVQLKSVTWTQTLDTLIFFHKDVPPHRLVRVTDSYWISGTVPFTNVPNIDYGNSPGGKNEVQRLRFADYAAGDIFNLSLDGQRTGSLAWAGAGMAAVIQAALQQLPNASSGIVVTGAGINEFEVTFGGASGKENWPEMLATTVQSDKGIISVSTVTDGEEPGEPIMSAARGWPRCGCFYQDSLYMGGFRSQPMTIVKSRAGGRYFDLNDQLTRADYGFAATAQHDQGVVILHMFAGLHLQIFTSGGEFFMPSEPITPETAGLKLTTRRGSEPHLPPHEVDGSTLFLQKGGAALREFQLGENSEGARVYQAENISLLAPHLIRDPVDVCLQRAGASDETDKLIIVRGDGGASVFTTLRSQEVTGFTRLSVNGRILAASAEDAGRLYLVVDRGAEGCFLLIEDATQWLDFSWQIAVGQPTSGFTLPQALAGKALHVIADGSYEGVHQAANSVLRLPFEVKQRLQVGEDYPVVMHTLPVRAAVPGGTSMTRKKRVNKITLSLLNTTSVAVGLVGRTLFDVPLRRNDSVVLDQPEASLRFSGKVEVGGLQGWDEDCQIEVRRSWPGPMTVRAMAMEVTI